MVRGRRIGFQKILLVVLFLLCFGLVMVYDASSASAVQTFSDKYYFLREQLKWIIIGLGLSTVAFFFDYKQLKKLALPGLLVSLLLLLCVFLPGIGIKAYGASRWINLGFMVLQASEVAKLALIIYLSAWLTTKEKGKLGAFLVLVGLLVGLIILEPDMGTAIVLFITAMILYFLSDNQILGLVFLFPLMILGGAGLAIRSPYRLKRILTFFDPDTDPLGASYHIRQALIALGSGGVFGLGLGNSRQKYSYLPEAMTDSIFAIIGEELGLIGLVVLVSIFSLFFFQSVKLTLKVEDPFGRLLGMGIIAWLAVQTMINIASIVGLIPLTGVPLPFISYGGSALVLELISMGILGNIWRQNLD
ncbi:putative lipid II flippase FtsW [Candidatus Microgenomates bacterium]|nr:putative lipid II flippase FtsW [Candidatus Microgenomates bacterium]